MAAQVKTALEDYKKYIPVIRAMCNPGLQARHFSQISAVIEFPGMAKEDTSINLTKLKTFNVERFITKLDEISDTAAKEFTL